jgi:nudix-type nucleoside diphosphatase (YffH/AdpP family)
VPQVPDLPGPGTGGRRPTVAGTEILADDWLVVTRYQLDVPGPDGTPRRQARVSAVRGDRVALLAHDRRRDTVLLTRQLRLPALLHGVDDAALLEAPGGLLDGDGDDMDAMKAAAVRETAEETGYRVRNLRPAPTIYPAAQLSAERLHLFLADYDADDRIGPGGGIAAEGEDVAVVELSVGDAFDRLSREPACDAKTLLLLLLLRAERAAAPGTTGSAGGQRSTAGAARCA